MLGFISLGETYGYELTQKLRELSFTDLVEGTFASEYYKVIGKI